MYSVSFTNKFFWETTGIYVYKSYPELTKRVENERVGNGKRKVKHEKPLLKEREGEKDSEKQTHRDRNRETVRDRDREKQRQRD